jgi:hypothetical protein
MNRIISALLIFASSLTARPQVSGPFYGPVVAGTASSTCTALPSTNLNLDLYAGSLSTSPFSSWPDISGNSNTATMTGSPTWANNTFGTGLAGATFNGSTQYGIVPASYTTLNYTQFYAVVKWTSNSANQALAGGTGSAYYTLGYDVDSTGHLRILNEGVTAIATSTGTLTSGTAADIAMLYSKTTENWSIYINGTLDSSGTFAGTAPTVTPLVVGADLVDNEWWASAIYEQAFYSSSSAISYQSAVHACWVTRGLP